MCGKMDVACYIKDGFQSVATNAIDQLRQEVSKSALSTLDSMTFWLRPKTPSVASEQTWANSPTVEFLHSSLLGVTGAVFAVAILIAGMRMAWEQRAKPLQDLLKTMLTFVVVAGMGTATMQLLISWSDAFSVAIVDKVAHDMSLAASFGGQVSSDGKVQSLVADSMPAVLAILSGVGVIVASLIQIVLMLVRSALLVLLAGAFPLAAAATNTEIGRNWFRKFCGWSLAFIAYKPAAALVYAAAMKLAHDHVAGGGGGGGDSGVLPAMTGMMMLLLAIVALPALLRFMVPVTAAVAGGGSAMGSSVADPGGMATGAVNVGSSAGRSARGAAGATGSSAGGGGGATGAALAGGKAAGAAASSVGVGLAAARKAAGGAAGAASHSAGESGGGAVTPPSASGPMAGRSGHRASRPRHDSAAQHSHSSTAQQSTPEPVGPPGAW